MKDYPLPKMLIGVIIGIMISRKLIVEAGSAIIISMGFIILIITGNFILKRFFYKYNLLNVVVLLFCVFTGIALQMTNNCIFYEYQSNEFQQNTLLKVISSPQLKGKNYRFKCKIIGEKNIPNTFVYIRNNEVMVLPKRSDIIQLSKKVNIIENGETSTFDFKRYCHRNNIAYSIYTNCGDINYIDTTNKSLHLFFDNIQEGLANKLLYYIQDSSCFSIAAALILGYDQLSQETRSVFSSTGAVHVLCVSGLHVSTIFLLISFLFKPFSNVYFRRYINPVISLIILWMYAAITGFSPSVTRASFMLSFILIGTLINRDVITINTLCGAAMLMIIANPNIIYNVGFQLSFGAVLGIITFNNEINFRLLKANRLTNKIPHFPHKLFENLIGLISVSISVQMLLAPILLYYFHIFPNYFLLSNIIAIPIATIILYLGIFLLLISPIKIIATLIGKLLNFVIKILVSGINIIHNIPFSTIEVSNLKVSQVVLFILLIFLFVNSLKLGFSKQKIIGSLLVVIMFIIIGII
ncbi:ComEC family competence protein [Bacteroidales bacterium OttesenSCG-928-K22]|nr:ComEC family competence protein [Bacteroidales bacterium OttesenSCG-928-L14]MDL2240231.1 ComEC family competence protein [Bacteroidales bacterium OttesenSCG-928-K22]